MPHALQGTARGRLGSPAAAAVVTALVFCAATARNGLDPFGPRSRLINDLGGQFVPFHAALRALLTGDAPGDLLFSWTSGAGVPWLPDYATYVGGPLAPLVVLFPRDHVDLAVFVISVVTLALAGGGMASLLCTLRPVASPWLAAVAGVAYGTCGWAVDDGSYVPMWLAGFAGLPLLCLVTLWSRQGRRFIVGTLVVATVWWANYYTAYMASVGAALFLTSVLAAEGRSVRGALAAVGRFAAQGVLGVALNSVLLVPTVLSVGVAQPGARGAFVRQPWSSVAARLLPGSEGVGITPGLTVGTVALLLAATFPFRSCVSARARVVWTVGLGALVASLQNPLTQSAWHGFEIPNGSPFRESFVVCAWLVCLAWLAVADGAPRMREVAGGAAVVAALAWFASGAPTSPRPLLDPSSVRVLAFAGTASVLLLAAARRRSRLRTLTSVALLAIVAVESVWTASVADVRRERLLSPTPVWSAFAANDIEAAERARDQWPPYRFATTDQRSGNEPAIVGAPGIDYYSSTMPAATTAMFVGLGSWWVGYGRAVRLAPDDVALGALLSVRTAFNPARGAQERPAFPLVRVVEGAGPATSGRSFPDAFIARARLSGPGVYTLPPVSGPRALPGGRTPITLTSSCPAGSTAEVFLPNAVGPVTVIGTQGVVSRVLTGHDGVVSLGTVEPGGRVVVTVASSRPTALSAHPVGCLDGAALQRSTAAAAANAPHTEVSGHGLEARWPAPQSGQVVVATAHSTAWACTADGRPTTTSALFGLLSVRVSGASTVSCSYRTPGLFGGLVGTASAALALAAIAVLGGPLSQRRERRSTARSAPAA